MDANEATNALLRVLFVVVVFVVVCFFLFLCDCFFVFLRGAASSGGLAPRLPPPRPPNFLDVL